MCDKIKQTICVLGGDLRQATLAELLTQDGYEVIAAGFDKHPQYGHRTGLEEVLPRCQALVLPLPASLDGKTVNAPLSEEVFELGRVFRLIGPDTMVLAGKANAQTVQFAARYGIRLTDYFLREELAVRNAVPTAEGAIGIAMEEMPITLHGSQCLITGFGRIAKVLAKDLAGLGAEVTVAARKHGDLAQIDAYGYHAVALNQIATACKNCDVLFNTIPAMILTREILSELPTECLVIDLASKPGGVDFDVARELSIKTIWALSLPGKVAPITAGKILRDTIVNILEEGGENI